MILLIVGLPRYVTQVIPGVAAKERAFLKFFGDNFELKQACRMEESSMGFRKFPKSVVFTQPKPHKPPGVRIRVPGVV